ncbi:MAG: hypothetical protein K2X27_20670 [Candidatus Obscuribacterales bacterium]|nr:hypothetical protein [Candidatus Obscuribacterales bacterium]
MGSNNEIQNTGDGGMRETGENQANAFRDELQGRENSANNYDSAKSACQNQCGEMSSWMSMKTDPEGFKAKTENIIAQGPEAIKENIIRNDSAANSVKNLISGIENKIAAVLKAQATQEALERANRMA